MRRTKISGASDFIIPGAVVIGGGILLYKLFSSGGLLSNLFQTGQSANNQATDTSTQAGQQATQKQLAQQGIVPTLTDSQLSQIANTIFSLGIQDPADVAEMNAQFSQINNIADLNKIIGYFGTRAFNASLSKLSSCYLFGYGCTQVGLNQFINAIYNYGDNAQYLTILNGFLTDQGINYQF